MRILLGLVLPLSLYAQNATPAPTTLALATRMSQLMESTAVAVPDLIRASEPLRQLATGTLASMRDTPRKSVFAYRFLNETKAYLALSESYMAPQLPSTAWQQFAELREDLNRLQQRFEEDLESQIEAQAVDASDPSNLRRYSGANAKLPPPGVAPRVVFLGDSITDAWPLNEYFTGRDFVNRGIGGQNTLQMLGRFQEDVVMTHAKAVVILGGTDDLTRNVSSGEIEDTLGMIGDLAKAHGIKAIFASVLPQQTTRVQEINDWLRNYCHREGFVYLDYFAVLSDRSGRMVAEFSDDGLRPNAKGYRVMSPVTLEAIDKALATSSPPPSPPQPRKRFGLPIIK